MNNHPLSRIWQKPKYLPYIQAELTTEMIQQAENQLGYPLPKQYLELLKIQNGGYIAYELADNPHSMIYGIGNKFPSLTDSNLEDAQEYVSFNLNGLIPFDGDGHWHICFDYRKNISDPSISWIDIECDEQTTIANNFNEYLNLLEFKAENEIVIHSEQSLEDFAKHIENLFNIKFEQPDSWAHGYPIYRTKIKNEWLWLQSNYVPVGFIRENETGYHELKHLAEIYTEKYSELDKYSYIIETSDENLSLTIYEKLKAEFSSVQFLADAVSPFLVENKMRKQD